MTSKQKESATELVPVKFSRLTRRGILLGLSLAQLITLAAGVLAPIGVVMPMSVGAILMSLSTVVVALNAQLLRRLDLRPDAVTGHGRGQRMDPGA